MDTPGVIAGVPGYDKSNVGEPKEVRCGFFNLRGGQQPWNSVGRLKKSSDWANKIVISAFFIRCLVKSYSTV